MFLKQLNLEIKKKNNKGKTIKERIKVAKIPARLTEEGNRFVQQIIGTDDVLMPKHWNKFSRITLVNKHIKERLTIDLGITFEAEERHSQLDNMIIAEVKQETSVPPCVQPPAWKSQGSPMRTTNGGCRR